ncbi:MAG: hypothetical protein JSS57_00460 [Proteobacteria bacterium]|nr:hypothetical protein [Pseudomonadota bacterium]
MKSKTALPFVVAIGILAATPSWAAGGEGSGGVHVSSGVAATIVAGASGLIYGGQGGAVERVAYASRYAPADAEQGKASSAVERSSSDETDGGLAQILSSLALVLVLVGKRVSG